MHRFTLALATLAGALSGCAVGYDSTLFMTKSNIGLDVDSKPPTAEVSIARREAVIGPSFEGGQKVPVLASFRANANPFSRFFFGVQSTFAGGDAALALAEPAGGPPVSHGAAQLCLTTEPRTKSIFGRELSIPGPGEVRPFLFGTDTSFGLKVAWSGLTAQMPDTVRLGFNRKEFAWAPLSRRSGATCKAPGESTDAANRHVVSMAPFLAVIDSDVTMGLPADAGVKWVQYFATGHAATNLANRDEIRKVVMDRMDPKVSIAADEGAKKRKDEREPKIDAIVAATKKDGDDTAIDPQKMKALVDKAALDSGNAFVAVLLGYRTVSEVREFLSEPGSKLVPALAEATKS